MPPGADPAGARYETYIVALPDPATLRCLAWWPATGLVMADAMHDDGTPVEIAPRHVLAEHVRLAAGAGLLPVTDPVGYLAEIEAAWRRRDGVAAAAGYTEDAVLVYGNAQTRTGEALRQWPQQWFDFAPDLRITKTFRSFAGDCLASEWESTYTHPVSGETVHERGAEFFFIRIDGKVYRHHMFEHTWLDDQQEQAWPAI